MLSVAGSQHLGPQPIIFNFRAESTPRFKSATADWLRLLSLHSIYTNLYISVPVHKDPYGALTVLGIAGVLPTRKRIHLINHMQAPHRPSRVCPSTDPRNCGKLSLLGESFGNPFKVFDSLLRLWRLYPSSPPVRILPIYTRTFWSTNILSAKLGHSPQLYSLESVPKD